MLNLLGDFIGELRTAGIPISMSEHVDTAQAVEVIDLGDRSLVKNSLAATLVKDSDHLPVFNTAFEVFFSTRTWDSAAEMMEDVDTDEMRARRRGRGERSRPVTRRGRRRVEFAQRPGTRRVALSCAVNRRREALRLGAGEAVSRYAGVEPGRPVGGTYYLFRTLRSLELENLEERLMPGRR